jgi:dTDP-4-amino-4,6-dideoxygalactose transaminase
VTNVNALYIARSATIRNALQQLDRCGTGVLLLNRRDGSFERTITDGDIRRLLLAGAGMDESIARLAQIDSIVLHEGYTRLGAMELLSRYNIDQIPVLDASGRAIRLLHRRDLDERIYLSSPHMGQSEREFIEEAFRSNWIAPLGPNVDAFERELAEVAGVTHAAAVSSGTAAIHLGLVLMNVSRGDEVLCSALTFAASANPIRYQGAEPVFVDSEPESWNMSPRALEAALDDSKRRGKMPRAAIVVNLYGQSADYDRILEICNAFGVPVLEDAAESLGAAYKGRPSGSFGLIGAFSFNGNKIITTSGGGMLVSGERTLVERARYLATQAREPAAHYEHVVIGYNYRMSNILAGIGRGQLRVLSDRVAARRRVFERYRDELKEIDALNWMPEPEWSFGNRWLTACTIDGKRSKIARKDVIAALAAEDIEARPIWKPMQLQPVFSGCRYFGHDGRSVSAELFETGMCLPSGSNMSESQQGRVIERLRRLFLA